VSVAFQVWGTATVARTVFPSTEGPSKDQPASRGTTVRPAGGRVGAARARRREGRREGSRELGTWLSSGPWKNPGGGAREAAPGMAPMPSA
jgi:hypothetical protein